MVHGYEEEGLDECWKIQFEGGARASVNPHALASSLPSVKARFARYSSALSVATSSISDIF